MLAEILEEYKDTDDEKEKKELLKEFKNRLWKSKYTLKTYKKYYRFRVNEQSLKGRIDLVELFSQYNNIEMIMCRSYQKGKDMTSSDYLRIHINNMYGFLTNKEIYLPKEYYKALLVPKNIYFRVVRELKSGSEVDISEIKNELHTSIKLAEQIKLEHSKKKLNLKWTEYKKLINSYIDKIFENYLPIHEYEQIHGWKMKVFTDGWNEDNYVVKYFSKSLTGYLKNYVKELNRNDEKFCLNCNKEINHKTKRKYCDECAKQMDRMKAKERMRKIRLVCSK